MNYVKLSVLAAALMAAGCMPYSSSEDIKSLSPDLAKNAKITTITVKGVPANVSAAFQPELESALRKRMDKCAKGTVEVNLDVTISEVKLSNPGRAFLVGDSSIIKGQARLTKDGVIVADYDISRSEGGGGLVGAVALAGERALASDFASELCSRAFPAKR